MPGSTLETPRLRLRRWRASDRPSFVAMNADPEVMEHFPSPMSRAASDAFVDWIEAEFEKRGFGLWAVEVAASDTFIGFTGLAVPTFEAHFTPTVEVGWRLARSAWGHGYATEAATAALGFGIDAVGLKEIVSFTSTGNVRSQAVMRRIGMVRDPTDDFDHPRVLDDDRLRRHVLYRMTATRWQELDRG